jgi:hypothetical protein
MGEMPSTIAIKLFNVSVFVLPRLPSVVNCAAISCHVANGSLPFSFFAGRLGSCCFY